MKEKLRRFFAFFDARDLFCLGGFVLLFVGVAGYDIRLALIVTGGIILIKGLVKWG